MRSPIITQPLCVPIEKKRVLVIDDIADTGESLALVVSEVRGRAEELRTATIYRKPWARFIPDFSARETDAWVVFPWELRETIERIGRRLLDSGKTLQEVGDGLALAGIDRRQVLAVLEDLCGEPSP
jgi:hypoxanthine phosphoribosyltransferase